MSSLIRFCRAAGDFFNPLSATPRLLLGFVGCTAPAPSAQFVAQADRLHDGAIASAVTSNTDLRDYLQLIGDRIADGARKSAPNRANEQLLTQLRCHLVNCPSITAFYTGGNHVYMYRGLVGVCENEDELAAAVAHEYAHAIAPDLEKTKMRPDPNRPLPAVAFEFVVNRLTADQESSADELALLIYSRAGWDPLRFPALFEHLSAITPAYAGVARSRTASDPQPAAARVDLADFARMAATPRRRSQDL